MVAGKDRRLVAAVGDDDIAEALFKILEIGGQTQDRHHFGGNGDIEPGFARKTIGHAAERADNMAKTAVVHVHHPAPGDTADVDILLVAPVDMIVDQRRQQIVRRRDRMKIAGEMQVDVLHRHHLRITAAGCPALDAETGAKRRLTDADDRLLANAVEPVAKADRGGGLAFTGRRRIDRSHQDQPPVRAALLLRDEVGADLGLVMAVGKQMFGWNSKLGTDLQDRLFSSLRGQFRYRISRRPYGVSPVPPFSWSESI